jgi:predicted CXXCH cytochrome family protein
MPRSPSRDLADRFRNNRGYFKRPEPLRWGKYALSVVAVVAVLAWSAVDFAVTPRSHAALTHGPVAGVHAMWDDDCAACHRMHSASEFGAASVLNVRDRWHDLTCERCHTGAVHHGAISSAHAPFANDCASCHYDHGGRDNSLVRMSDEHCTVCHANLGQNHAAGKSQYENSITSFVGNHPEFGPLKDPAETAKNRKLKFSHALHMTPGIRYLPESNGAMTVERIAKLSDAASAERYRKPGQPASAPVALDCQSCHQLDSGNGSIEFDRLKTALEQVGAPVNSLLPPRAAGAYFLPINFEAHCQACHPLNASAQKVGDRDEVQSIVEGFKVPHRKQIADLQGELTAAYIRQMLKEKHGTLEKPVEPGGLLQQRDKGEAASIRAEAERFADQAKQRFLTGKNGCVECHDLAGGKIVPVPDHTVWFTHAKFNHASHRGVSCASCHPNTGAAFAPGGNVIEKEPLQITGVKSCQVCHSPNGTTVKTQEATFVGGGMRHDCVECHRYHNGDHALQGRGAEALDPKQKLTLPEFLSGK